MHISVMCVFGLTTTWYSWPELNAIVLYLATDRQT